MTKRLICCCVLPMAAVLAAGCNDGKAMAPAGIGKQPPGGPAPARRPAAPGPSLQAELDRLARRADPLKDEEVGNAFSATSWYVPPPPPRPAASQAARPAPPAPPTAPAMPFTYFGRYADSSMHVVILVKGDQLYTVSEGDTIEGKYRIERVGAGMVEMTYLPLNIRQSLNTGDAS